ncbi:MAG: hypothetical protein EPO12_19585 [Aquabacterium sp.]|nr:MAG: hypothetical protein EPO12_19585 [Aquabacterium sp.]
MPSAASSAKRPPIGPHRGGNAAGLHGALKKKHMKAHAAWQRGVDLNRAGRHVDASHAFEEALRLAPGDALYWTNYAAVLNKLNRRDESFKAARQAWELDRTSWVTCQLLTQLLRDFKKPEQALQTLEELDPATKREARYFLLVGACLSDMGKHQESVNAFLDCLARAPDDREAHSQMGFAFSKLRSYAEAAQCFRTVLAIEPTALDAALYAAHYSAWACDWPLVDADKAALADCIDLLQPDTVTEAISPFCLLSLIDDPQLMKFAAQWDMRRFRNVAPAWDPAAQPRPALAEGRKRIRVGFVSGDFHHHATSMLIVDALEQMDRGRFEIHLYSHGNDDKSALRKRVMAAADQFVECVTMNQAEEVERIRADGVDVLVDLKGFTQNSRIGVFGRRPAPIQVAWLGYPGTCGAPFIDYIVGDPIVTPLAAEDDFTEKIAQMPVCYQPNDGTRSRGAARSREDCGLPEDRFVFASFNQSYKITEDIFGAWCRILNQVPDSLLWLLVPDEPVQARLRIEAQRRGIAPDRLVFADFEPIERHRLRIPQADLFLDTFPCGAHTTASDALWAGVPVVTLAGQGFATRVAASLLHAVDLGELACNHLSEYETRAINLAHDRAKLDGLRSHLRRSRDFAPLFRADRFARDLGDLFIRMVERYDQGLPPAALPANK